MKVEVFSTPLHFQIRVKPIFVKLRCCYSFFLPNNIDFLEPLHWVGKLERELKRRKIPFELEMRWWWWWLQSLWNGNLILCCFYFLLLLNGKILKLKESSAKNLSTVCIGKGALLNIFNIVLLEFSKSWPIKLHKPFWF